MKTSKWVLNMSNDDAPDTVIRGLNAEQAHAVFDALLADKNRVHLSLRYRHGGVVRAARVAFFGREWAKDRVQAHNRKLKELGL